MKRILFLHGFYASGQCVPAVALKEAFEGSAIVMTPDLPMHPQEAVGYIRELVCSEKPDVVVGNSCGSFYAQMIAPAMGHQDFVIDEQLIGEFAEMEAHQFDNYHPSHQDKVWGLFGEQDTLAHFEPLFLKYYAKSFHFPGGHTPTAEEVRTWYVPLIKKIVTVI